MSCGSPLGRRTLRRSGRRLERSRGVQGGVAARRSAAEPDELRIPPGSWDAPKERATSGEGPGVQGGVAARRSAAEPDELRIPPGSWDAPKERATSGEGPGVQGGVAARRSAAEPDELRIPPGSWDAPEGAGDEWKSGVAAFAAPWMASRTEGSMRERNGLG